MKTKTLGDRHISTAGRGTSHKAATWLLGLALTAAVLLFPATLFAELLDDFEDPMKSAQAWTAECLFGTCDSLVTGGQLRLAVTPSGDHGYSIYTYNGRTFRLDPRRTMESRVDLISCNADGATAWLQFTPADGGYWVGVDPDSVGLSKNINPERVFFLTNGIPFKTQNVKLVLTMACGESEVIIRVRSIDNVTGAVLLDRQFRDTAAQDRLQIGTDEPPASYLGKSGRFELVLYHDNAGKMDPDVTLGHNEQAVVVFDNAEVLEYDSTWIFGPQPVACLPSWPENTAEEQILIGASSLASDAVWTPLPEPIYKWFGQFHTAVPFSSTRHQLFAKLVPGTQFIDDFSDAKEPFVGRNPWVPYFYDAAAAARVRLAVTNGVFRIQTLAPAPLDGRIIIAPPGTLPVFRDFTASVDILKFTVEQDHGIGIYARGSIGSPFPGDSNGYIGQLYMNRIATWVGDHGVQLPFTCDPAAQYRLQFSAVGSHLTLRLVNLTTGETLEQALTDTTFSQGFVTLAVPKIASGQSFDIILDNFFVTGTKP